MSKFPQELPPDDRWDLYIASYRRYITYAIGCAQAQGSLEDPEQCALECELAVWRAAQRYDPQGGASLSTFTCQAILNAVRGHIARQLRRLPTLPLDDPAIDERSFRVEFDAEEILVKIGVERFLAEMRRRKAKAPRSRLARIVEALLDEVPLSTVRMNMHLTPKEWERQVAEGLAPVLAKYVGEE